MIEKENGNVINSVENLWPQGLEKNPFVTYNKNGMEHKIKYDFNQCMQNSELGYLENSFAS